MASPNQTCPRTGQGQQNDAKVRAALRSPFGRRTDLRYWAAGLTPRWPRSLRLTPSRLGETYAAMTRLARGLLRSIPQNGGSLPSEGVSAKKIDAKGAARGALRASASAVADGAAGLSPRWPRSLRLNLRVFRANLACARAVSQGRVGSDSRNLRRNPRRPLCQYEPRNARQGRQRRAARHRRDARGAHRALSTEASRPGKRSSSSSRRSRLT